MLLPAPLLSLATVAITSLLASPVSAAESKGPLSSPKRGLCYTPNSQWPQDNYVWTRQPSSLTWYYNYQAAPSPVFGNISQEAFEFVPMLWGAPSNPDDTTFLTSVQGMIKATGSRHVNITHVMGFNEPDGKPEHGGSLIDPKRAAGVWVKNMIPLGEMGVKLGLPAPTGGWDGVPWLRQFLGNCSEIISTGGEKKNCTYDFVPIHWYGNFDGLASHIGTYSAAFPGKKIWITEYNYNDQPLRDTQSFYNVSSEYFDRMEVVERYSIFAAFRSKTSNVGPNAAMLSNGGQLTDIGAWYLGRQATGVSPESTSAAFTLTPSVTSWVLLLAPVTVSLLSALGI